MANDILGTGWQFPVKLNRLNNFEMSEDEKKVEESILIIMGTNHGERIMRPEFGCNLGSVVFEPINYTTLNLINYLVRVGLTRFEPRIEVEDVVSAPSEKYDNLVEVHLTYSLRSTSAVHNLVYPFYLQEGGE